MAESTSLSCPINQSCSTNKSEHFRERRKDLSPYLFHFVNGLDPDPMRTLRCILDTKKVIRYDSTKPVCFTEAPLSGYVELLDYFKAQYPYRPLYTQYGIGFERECMHKCFGAKPVIYGDETLKSQIDPSIHWLWEKYDAEKDFTWLREWRVQKSPFDFSHFPKDGIIVVAPSITDLEKLVADYDIDVDFSYESDIRDVIPHRIVNFSRKWKGITFDMIRKGYTDYQVHAFMDKLKIGQQVRLHDENGFCEFNNLDI